MTLLAGSRFGSYEITALLGAGGMGEVYRARDTNLKREVAIKVLPPALAGDAERLARFRREAELLAAVNHPNIAQIYGLERSDGTTALVMELVSGQTLAERFAHGVLAVEESLGIARQIADALEAAHERGIVHRDLKPANVLLTADGIVKVLDFGIAKPLDTRTTGPGPAALTTPAMTEAGIVLGTAAYMSPEQARGKTVDQRADIWAFGCVLYELLTGQLAFGADDITLVLARVLERSPDFAALPASTPPAVRRTLELCLEKDPKKRIADIRDVKLALAGQFAPAVHDTTLVPRSRSRALPLAAAALVVGGIAAWSLKPAPPPEPRPVVRATHSLPESAFVRALTNTAVAIAPDGRSFAYLTTRGIHLRTLDALEERVIPGTSGGNLISPAFSPDGQSLAYFAGGELRRLAVSGGASVALAPAGTSIGIRWQSDGTILYAQGREGIWQVPENGGEPQRLVVVENGITLLPQRLPGGEWVLFTLVRRASDGAPTNTYEIVAASTVTGERRTLRSDASGARYLPTGHLVYATDGVLYAAPFDVERLEFTAGHAPVVEGIRGVALAGIPQLDISAAGNLVYVPGPVEARGDYGIWVIDRSGGATQIGVPAGPYVHVRTAPNNARIALDSDDGTEAIVWIYDLAATSAIRRLTFEGRNQYPLWSPDGERLAFQSDRGGDRAVWAQRIDGAGSAQRLTTPAVGEEHIPEAWSPDGRYLLFTVLREGVYSLSQLSVADGAVTPFGTVQSIEPIGATFSADGQWLAYHVFPRGADVDSPSGGVFMEPFPPTGARYQAPKVSRDFQPVWSRDTAELYFVPSTASRQIAAVRVSAAAGLSFESATLSPFTLGAERLSGQTRAFDALPDGRFVGPARGAEAQSLAAEVRFVVNWFEELKRLVPTE